MSFFDFLSVKEIKSELEKTKNELVTTNLENRNLKSKSEELLQELDITTQKLDKLHSDFSLLMKKYTELRAKNETLENITTDFQKRQQSLEDFLKSNVSSFPFLAGVIADYITYDMEILAKKLDWGHSVERSKKLLPFVKFAQMQDNVLKKQKLPLIS